MRKLALFLLMTVGITLSASMNTLNASQRAQIPTGGEIPDERKRDRNPEKTTEVVRHVQDNVYVIAGIGSNISVLPGTDVILIVDAQYQEFTPKILAGIKQIADGPVRFLIDTHSHVDHTGGNAPRE